MSLPIGWERVEIERGRSCQHKRRANMVWLSSSGKSINNRLNKVGISPDLCKTVGLKDGDTVWLYRSGDTMMIRKEPSDFAVHGKEGAAMILTNWQFAAKIASARTDETQTEFEAIVIDGGVVFQV